MATEHVGQKETNFNLAYKDVHGKKYMKTPMKKKQK